MSELIPNNKPKKRSLNKEAKTEKPRIEYERTDGGDSLEVSWGDDLKNVSEEVEALGGKNAFISGDWFLRLVQKSFRNYWDRATPEYFSAKYGNTDEQFLIRKLTKTASRNAMALGAAAGAAISADQIAGLAGIPLTGGVSLPTALAVAGTVVTAEALLLTRLQLKLVARIGRAMNIPLDPDDPEDILTVMAFAVGGAAADAAGTVGMKIGGHAAKTLIRKHISKETLKAVQRVAAKIGVKILQRTIIKYAVPAVSIAIGGGWNFGSTKLVASTAQKHFDKRRGEMT
ncbi:MAG: hypothetical protein P1V20_03335 [Verrucomicrobiales bacterium]|nr:hypothetical protein [Verrucomicrobiales bacterium]